MQNTTHITNTDEALVALRHGDIRGLEVLVGVYQRQAINVAFGILGERVAAEDCVSDAFLKVYDRISRYDTRRPFAPWFYRIVVNTALKARRERGRVNGQLSPSVDMSQEDTALDPAGSLAGKETRLALVKAINALPDKQRAVVVLRYYLEMDERTIAQTIGRPLGTVKWRLHAARNKLRDSLAPTGEVGFRLVHGEGETK